VISAMRTGAVSGLAARALALPGARTVTLYGAGVQARTQLLALELALPELNEIRVVDPSDAQVERFVREQSPRRPPIIPFDDPREAARGGHVLVAATMAQEPFITAEWLEPGMLVLSVSSLDIDVDAVVRADLVATDDLKHETFHPSRPLSRARQEGALDESRVVTLGAILAGDHPGRTRRDERVVVSAVGLGIEDIAWATAVYRRAVEAGHGQEQRLWHEPIWT
jgi:ornithine cyclodeaminase/alanine dehydrogenase-like protein (mu-crystallin family)